MSKHPIRIVGVSNILFHELHATFDRGDSFAFSGKDDGTNRRLQRGTDSFIRDVDTGAIIVRREQVAMGVSNIGLKSDQSVLSQSQRWKFESWTYDDAGKPTGKTFRHTKSGKTRFVKLNGKAAIGCAHCGVRGCGLHRCAGCKKVSYCNPVCQTSDWSQHKQKCTHAM